MVKVNLVTQKEYATMRHCSGVAVHKAVKTGRISLIDGLIDPAVADAQWAANTRARASARSQPADQVPAPAADSAVSPQPVSDDGYALNRARREQAEAALAEMKEAEMRGNLIRTDSVRTAWAGKITAARDALLQIPSRLAPVLAAETDLDRVTELLEAELRQALTQLSETKTTEPPN